MIEEQECSSIYASFSTKDILLYLVYNVHLLYIMYYYQYRRSNSM